MTFLYIRYLQSMLFRESMLTSNSVLIQQQSDMIITRLARTINSSRSVEDSVVTTTPSMPSDHSLLCSQPRAEINQDRPSLANNADRTERRRRERVDRVRRLHIPIQLINLAWEVEFFRTRSGWTVNLQTINYVPNDSPIFDAVRSGDLERIKELFRRGEASINDVMVDGPGDVPLFTVSFQLLKITPCLYGKAVAGSFSLPIFKFLLQESADPLPR